MPYGVKGLVLIVTGQLDWVRNWMQELLKLDQGGYVSSIVVYGEDVY